MAPFLVIDTETTGLPCSFKCKADVDNFSNWDTCRMVQIAWRVYNDSYETLAVRERLIVPNGFTIPDDATAIHGISTAFATDNGKQISDVLFELINDVKHFGVDTAIAHNMRFDDNVVASEMYRIGEAELVKVWKSLRKYCTMLNNAYRFGGTWPKLAALYQKVVGTIDPSTKLHSADDDCRLCAEIYIATR